MLECQVTAAIKCTNWHKTLTLALMTITILLRESDGFETGKNGKGDKSLGFGLVWFVPEAFIHVFTVGRSIASFRLRPAAELHFLVSLRKV